MNIYLVKARYFIEVEECKMVVAMSASSLVLNVNSKSCEFLLFAKSHRLKSKDKLIVAVIGFAVSSK